MRIGAVVLTLDAHFSQIDGLRVIAPPAEWFGGWDAERDAPATRNKLEHAVEFAAGPEDA